VVGWVEFIIIPRKVIVYFALLYKSAVSTDVSWNLYFIGYGISTLTPLPLSVGVWCHPVILFLFSQTNPFVSATTYSGVSLLQHPCTGSGMKR